MYRKIRELQKKHQFLYSLLIGVGIIAAWRGAWGLLDLYLFPGNELLSFGTSFVVGVFIIYTTHQRLS